MKQIAFGILLFLLGLMPSVSAQDRCPQKLSMPDLAPVQVEFTTLLLASYQALGCTPEIIPFPGRRGIYAYNHGQVDGETFRLPLVERHYGRPFVRSRVPLFYFTTGICSRPDHRYTDRAALGYVRGVVWHEQHVGEPAFRIEEHGRVFASQEAVFRAYNNGLIDHFLCETLVLRAAIAKGRFAEPPALEVTLARDPAYHYLNQSFAPFMRRLSDYLQQHDPFAELN